MQVIKEILKKKIQSSALREIPEIWVSVVPQPLLRRYIQ